MITPPNHTLKHLTAAWQAQVRAAADKPWLFDLLMRQWARLFRRFAHYYQRLLALPHPHKRALKRTLATTLVGAALLLALSQPSLPTTTLLIFILAVLLFVQQGSARQGSLYFCTNFNSGDAEQWTPEGEIWNIFNGHPENNLNIRNDPPCLAIDSSG